MDAGEMVREGYLVLPAVNGGWILEQRLRRDRDNPFNVRPTAAFSNTDDLLSFLGKEHAALLPSRADEDGERIISPDTDIA